MASALVDLGSGFTLVKKTLALKLKGEINSRRATPCLTGIGGTPLKILGAVFLEIIVGEEKVHKQWVTVVPDNLLTTDLLLGCDTLGQSILVYNQRGRIITWGNSPYVISHLSRGRVRQVSQISSQAALL